MTPGTYGAVDISSSSSSHGPPTASTSQNHSNHLDSPTNAAAARLRRASRASSIRTAGTGIILVSHSQPDELTRLLNDSYFYIPTSSALQITDLSVQPVLLDTPSHKEPLDSFRRCVLLSLDNLRGLLLALHADENIQLFLRADRENDENWYSKQTRWTESPLYALRLLANPAAPGLMLLGGIGVVLFQQSRLQLGWSRWKLLWHFTTRAGTLMIVNLLLTIDFTLREDGPTVVENLLLFSFGVNLFLLGSISIGLHSFERYITSIYLAKHENDSVVGSDIEDLEGTLLETSPTLKAETIAHHIGNAAILLLAALLLMVNMLVVPKYGTVYSDKSDWFWFWIMPNPATSPGGIQEGDVVYHRLLSQYPPLNWLPFGLLGVLYARFLTRRHRSRFALHSINLALFLLFTTLFILTRVLQFGNLSSELLPAHPRHPNNPYFESWQAFLYTIKFPPDLAYTGLSLGAIAILFAFLTSLKTSWREALPVLQFGRAPIFFYAANLLVFRFVANVVLTFFGLPSRLEFGPALCCYFGTLVITWFLCRAFLTFKDARSSPDSVGYSTYMQEY